MDLKGEGIDGCEAETIYPVNTVTAKTAHLITIYLFQTLAQGRAGSCRFCYWKRRGTELPQGWSAAVGMAAGVSYGRDLYSHLLSPLTRRPSLNNAHINMSPGLLSKLCCLAFCIHCHLTDHRLGGRTSHPRTDADCQQAPVHLGSTTWKHVV